MRVNVRFLHLLRISKAVAGQSWVRAAFASCVRGLASMHKNMSLLLILRVVNFISASSLIFVSNS